MATMATNHVTVAMGHVATTSLPRYSHFFISNYIIPSHYDQMLFFSVYLLISRYCGLLSIFLRVGFNFYGTQFPCF